MGAPIDVNRTVAELVIEHPSLTRVFERLGIDYCCGGKRSLLEACQKKGLDAETVVLTIDALAGSQLGVDETDWTQVELTDLCDNIEQTHHRYLKEELPRLAGLVQKVTRVHGNHHPELHQVHETFNEMSAELLSHLQKEEQILFPLIRTLDSGKPAGPVGAPITQMETEHDGTGDSLEILSKVTDRYTPPAGACGSYRAMLSGLKELEQDIRQHIHKENNILFPRATKMEEEAV